ncbi:MAG: hypothetical protein GY819_06430 [Planctomycetaceae bacterium]|nr:hypothetical protein [Planctomycetaceae bacterium]
MSSDSSDPMEHYRRLDLPHTPTMFLRPGFTPRHTAYDTLKLLFLMKLFACA